MLCQKCNKNEAEFHYKTNINGQVSELHLCAACAAKAGQDSLFPFGGSYLSSVLSDFMEPLTQQPELGRCPLCGATARDIQRSGKVGCAKCYETFDRLLLPYIKRIHGVTRHNGKLPSSAGAALQQQRTMEAIKAELQKAVEAQEYERAAELRDKLKALQNGQQG